MKLFILVFLSLFAIQNANSLQCYITDLKTKDNNIKTTVQDCKQSVEEFLSAQTNAKVTLPSDMDLRCYTVVVASDTMTVNIKGCVPSGGCSIMQDTFRTMYAAEGPSSQIGNPDENVKCYECSGDLCNSSFHIKANYLIIAIFLFSTKLVM